MRRFWICLIGMILHIAHAATAMSDGLFWNASGSGIVQANLDGSNVSTFRSEAVHGVAVDPKQRRIYWNNPVENTLRLARLDGSNVQTIASNVGTGDIALDLLNGKIYWNASGGGIVSSNLDGSGVSTICSEAVAGVVVDPFQGRIYWNNPVENALRWARLDGSDVQTIASNVGTGDIALDLLHGKIYWNASGGGIIQSNLDGSGITTFRLEAVHGLAVDPFHDRIYWNNPVENTLRWARLDGSNVQTLAANVGTGAMALNVAFVPEPLGLMVLGLPFSLLARQKRSGANVRQGISSLLPPDVPQKPGSR